MRHRRKTTGHVQHSLGRRAFELLLIVLIVVISSADEAPEEAPEQSRPNVLLLMADEHSGRVMGCAGNKIVKTPTLDSLAKSGVYFRSAYCQNPICVPSRASLAAGMMPSKVGVFGNKADLHHILRDRPVTLARVFTNAGYTAEWLGKEHWGTDNAGLGFGDRNVAVKKKTRRACGPYFDLFDEVGRLPQNAQTFGNETKPIEDTIVASQAVKWLNRYNGGQPFFLGVSLKLPHFPFLVEEKYYNMYKDIVDLPRVTKRMINGLPLVNQRRRAKYKFAEMTDEEIKKARAVYYGMVTYVDRQLKQVIRKLEEKGLRDDTIIVYLSDHGEHAGEHGIWYKNSFYEDSAMVPLMFSYPKAIPANTSVHSHVQIMDVFPTLCDLCNITIPEGLDGKSLMPLVRGEENGWRRHVISETYAFKPGRMVRYKQWKYNWYEEGGNQLFHLKRDPAEQFNLYGTQKYAEVVELLHKLAMEEEVIQEPEKM